MCLCMYVYVKCMLSAESSALSCHLLRYERKYSNTYFKIYTFSCDSYLVIINCQLIPTVRASERSAITLCVESFKRHNDAYKFDYY